MLQSLIGQHNLVFNGSFEEFSECPTLNELNNGQFERAIGWFRPTFGTPDFYHQCNIIGSGIVGVPTNFWGYQEAFEGSGYVGIVPIEWNVDGEYVGAEYCRTELLSPLKPCVEYRFRMYVSLANYSTHGVGKLGALFTEDDQFVETWLTFVETPQVIHSGSPISDTVNWTKIEGDFVAKGFEKYLTIGYFCNNVSMDTVFIQDWGVGSAPYYYIDSVSLIEIGPVSEEICEAGEIAFPNIITPNNDNSNDQINATPYFTIAEEIVILNRWGNVITILTEDNPIWDGTTRDGKPCSEGHYFYTFTYQWGTQVKEKSGFIQLVR